MSRLDNPPEVPCGWLGYGLQNFTKKPTTGRFWTGGIFLGETNLVNRKDQQGSYKNIFHHHRIYQVAIG